MRADNAHHLAAAAAKRSAQTLQRARTTLEVMIRDGHIFTAAELARRARVSRSWLYTQPALLHELTRHQPAPSATPRMQPVADRASESALLQRLRLAHDRNRSLTAEVDKLRAQIAVLYGELRNRKLPTAPG
jgi:hypothetical protein